MKTNLSVKTAIVKLADSAAKLSANSTTCIALGQPKAPAALKKFSKHNNDK